MFLKILIMYSVAGEEMTSLKVFGLIAMVMVAGTIAIPALALQTQNQTKLMDCDNTCDGIPDQTQDRLQKRTMDCSCDGTQARDRLQDGVMKQDRDRICTVADQLRTQQGDKLRIRNC
jgi:hypothetical protein